jgi:hypothetical protein
MEMNSSPSSASNNLLEALPFDLSEDGNLEGVGVSPLSFRVTYSTQPVIPNVYATQYLFHNAFARQTDPNLLFPPTTVVPPSQMLSPAMQFHATTNQATNQQQQLISQCTPPPSVNNLLTNNETTVVPSHDVQENSDDSGNYDKDDNDVGDNEGDNYIRDDSGGDDDDVSPPVRKRKNRSASVTQTRHTETATEKRQKEIEKERERLKNNEQQRRIRMSSLMTELQDTLLPEHELTKLPNIKSTETILSVNKKSKPTRIEVLEAAVQQIKIFNEFTRRFYKQPSELHSMNISTFIHVNFPLDRTPDFDSLCSPNVVVLSPDNVKLKDLQTVKAGIDAFHASFKTTKGVFTQIDTVGTLDDGIAYAHALRSGSLVSGDGNASKVTHTNSPSLMMFHIKHGKLTLMRILESKLHHVYAHWLERQKKRNR